VILDLSGCQINIVFDGCIRRDEYDFGIYLRKESTVGKMHSIEGF